MATNSGMQAGDIHQFLQGGSGGSLDLLNLDASVLSLIQQDPSILSQDPSLQAALREVQQQQQQQVLGAPRTAVPQPKVTPSTSSSSASRPAVRPLSGAGQPFVELVEQPKSRGLRFRYECEGRSAGSIPGERSTTEKRTYPTIKIHNYNGPAVIVVSCVTKDEPYRPHPHNLVGKDCKKGVCTLRIRDTNTVTFPHLGIQCAKKKDVEDNLKLRQEINVDPYQTGFKHKSTNLDLNVVRLCFQVFLPDETGKITRIVPPVVSQCIHDKKALNDLVICRVDRTSGKSKGGDEVFLLCEKINRDDIRIRFFEERDEETVWENFGDFSQNDVHRQFAIVFRTPAYKDQYISKPVEVKMQLQRISDLDGSDPIPFTYMPEDPDPDRILEKRKRKANSSFFGDGAPISQEDLKQRLKLKASRSSTQSKPEMKIKQELMTPEVPKYAYNNFGIQDQGDLFGSEFGNTAGAGASAFSAVANSQMDNTVFSQTSMSGGKVQYTARSPATSQISTLSVSQMDSGNAMMSDAGVGQQSVQNNPNQVVIDINNPNVMAQLQLLMLVSQQQKNASNENIINDPNLQAAVASNQGESFSSLDSMLANYLEQQPSGDVSMSLGSMGDINLDNLGAFENVSAEGVPNFDETKEAINSLNQAN
nr:P65 [Sinohyriopsis cumingii]